jgi:hypothetical protein
MKAELSKVVFNRQQEIRNRQRTIKQFIEIMLANTKTDYSQAINIEMFSDRIVSIARLLEKQLHNEQ